MAPANPIGKTLSHQRHKSSPALSVLLQQNASRAIATAKSILGEANGNIKLGRASAADDSNVGKASPEKLAVQAQIPPAKSLAPLSRPATRPLSSKSMVALNRQSLHPHKPSIYTDARSDVLPQEPAKAVVAKKSTRVLRDTASVPARKELSSIEELRTTPAIIQTGPAIIAADNQETIPEIAKIDKTQTVLHQDKSPSQELPAIAQVEADVPSYSSYPDPIARAQPEAYQPSYLPLTTINNIEEADEEEYYVDEGYTTSRSFGLPLESTGCFTTVLAPVWTESVLDELATAKEIVELNRTPEDIEEEQWDTSMVAEYGEEIFSHMRDLEERMSPNPHYMDQQQEIQWSMRAVLMDWVVQVHDRFNLLPETLFLTVNYIDRFLSCKIVSLGKLQLVGATAIFIAAKYEEVQCPTISEIIFMVDNGYTVDELLKAERFMLSMLMFELGWPGPMSFLRRISKADDYDLETRTLAKYFLEITVMDERFVGSTPSFLAAGAHCMARLMLGKGDWSPAHVHYSGYTYGQLAQLLNGILECCEDPERHHAAVFEKYTDKRYKRASTFVAGMMQKGYRLPSSQPNTTRKSLRTAFGLW